MFDGQSGPTVRTLQSTIEQLRLWLEMRSTNHGNGIFKALSLGLAVDVSNMDCLQISCKVHVKALPFSGHSQSVNAEESEVKPKAKAKARLCQIGRAVLEIRSIFF